MAFSLRQYGVNIGLACPAAGFGVEFLHVEHCLNQEYNF